MTLQVVGPKALHELIITSDITFQNLKKSVAAVMKVAPEDVELAWSCNLTPLKQWSTPRAIDSAAALRKLVELASKVESGEQKIPKGKTFEITMHNLNSELSKGKEKKGGKEKVRHPVDLVG
jgi:hypothetical protein